MSGPLFPRHPSTRREVARAAERAIGRAQRALAMLDGDAHAVRQGFVPKARPDGLDEATHRRRQSKEYMVKGRIGPQGYVWDVFELRTTGRPVYVIGGFIWQAEAIARARDLLLGRVSVSFAGARAVFRAPGRGRLVEPMRQVDRAGEAEVRVTQRDGGMIVSR